MRKPLTDRTKANERLNLSPVTVKTLVKNQFPQWQSLPLTQVEPGGWDNITYRLGEKFLLRLPSAACYSNQVEREQQWLPIIAKHLSVTIPTPVAKGKPDDSYPYYWSVYRWIEGINLSQTNNIDRKLFALQLANFLKALHSIDIINALQANKDNFYRGAHLSVYDDEVKKSLLQLSGVVDTKRIADIWHAALKTQWDKEPVWLHGDMSADNKLFKNEQLTAVIDFGCMAVGDPACDLVIAWTIFDAKTRNSFYQNLTFDQATWLRAAGWALWKSMLNIIALPQANLTANNKDIKIINTIINDKRLQ